MGDVVQMFTSTVWPIPTGLGLKLSQAAVSTVTLGVAPAGNAPLIAEPFPMGIPPCDMSSWAWTGSAKGRIVAIRSTVAIAIESFVRFLEFVIYFSILLCFLRPLCLSRNTFKLFLKSSKLLQILNIFPSRN
jgi:hypothetical protein